MTKDRKKRRSKFKLYGRFFKSETLTGSGNKLLDAAAVFVGTGVDFDLVARVHESGKSRVKPVAKRAGFITLPDVSPLTAGSV